LLGTGSYTSVYNADTNTASITMNNGASWRFVTGATNHCDHSLGLNAANLTFSNVQTIHPDIRGKTEQLLICGNVGRSETLGPKGSLNCLCRIPLAVGPGEVMHYENQHPSERIAVGNQMLSRLHFRITDITGIEVNGRGNISFSLLFE
jgi:hypothetical protein